MVVKTSNDEVFYYLLFKVISKNKDQKIRNDTFNYTKNTSKNHFMEIEVQF